MALLVDPITNSLNLYHENCMADSKENYLRDPGNERDKRTWLHLFNPQPYLHTCHRHLVTNEGFSIEY